MGKITEKVPSMDDWSFVGHPHEVFAPTFALLVLWGFVLLTAEELDSIQQQIAASYRDILQ